MATLIMIWLFCGAIAAAIAHAKNQRVGVAFLWGSLLGIIGIIIVLCWQTIHVNPPQPVMPMLPPPGLYPDPTSGLQRYWDGRAWGDLPPEPQRLI
jgi:hypothetical protein